ncbi:hypothetical protein [Legionella fallonii]|uniref:Uncharacterized protein n=1 Tax=Legionella fallonii LLAP-10 TaxID=1212491 RepID=A0A098G6Z1_9GAMM|nr:hypothetical protein [Legionella fallonii]CEG57749.1 conserved protein of unknown function [Legionella fallonii LLAP-10]
MQYRVTEHYARGEEKLIAEFSELPDTKIFTAEKLALAAIDRKKLIYRIYDDAELLHEFNEQQISIAYANYADGHADISQVVSFPFSVMLKTKEATEKRNIANFNDKEDVYLFVFSKCKSDNIVQDSDLFFITKDGQYLLDTLNKVICASRQKQSSSDSTDDKGERFSPTALPSRPKPPGEPGDYWIEDNSDDESP